MSFDRFNLSPDLMSGLADIQLDNPTPLLDAILPPALDGKHLLINTKDVSGDDAAILIPAIQKLAANGDSQGKRVLIITPSTDRAKNIDELIWAVGYHANVGSISLSMKGDYDEQVKAIEDGAPIIVANPGRLDDILKKNKDTFNGLSMIIIEEAHEMYNYNMVKKVINLFDNLSDEPQVMIFSNEYNDATRKLALRALKNPELVGFDEAANSAEESSEPKAEKAPSKNGSAKATKPKSPKKAKPKKDGLSYNFISIPPRLKISVLMSYLEESGDKPVIIFAASRKTTDRLYKIIKKKDWTVVSLHPELEEEKFQERQQAFVNGEKEYLLLGEMNADAIQFESCTLVINYDVPNEKDEFLGRAAFSEKVGAMAYTSLVSKMDRKSFDEICSECDFEVIELPLPEEVQEKKGKAKAKDKEKPKAKPKGQGKPKPKSKSQNQRTSNRGGGPNKGRGRGNRNQNQGGGGRRGGSKKSSYDKTALPQAKYDKLSGGREGESTSKGVVGFFKKLFS